MITILTIMRTLAPFKEIIGISVLILSVLVGGRYYINKRVQEGIDNFKKEQESVILELRQENDQLEKVFKNTTDSLEQQIEQNRRVTQDVIESFKNQDGASDPSGIDGKFLRD